MIRLRKQEIKRRQKRRRERLRKKGLFRREIKSAASASESVTT